MQKDFVSNGFLVLCAVLGFFSLCGRALADTPLVIVPISTSISGNTATLKWYTCRVEVNVPGCGENSNYVSSENTFEYDFLGFSKTAVPTESSASSTTHQAKIKNLVSFTTYFYIITAKEIGTTNLTTLSSTFITPDVKSPENFSVDSLGSGKFYKGKIISLSGSATDNVEVTRVEVLLDGATKGNAILSSNIVTKKTNWQYGLDTKSVALGNHSLIFKVYDAAGNFFQPSAPTSFNLDIDTAKPVVTITAPSSISEVINLFPGQELTVTGTATDAHTEIASVYAQVFSNAGVVGSLANLALSTSGQWSYKLIASNTYQPGKQYTLEIGAQDTAGVNLSAGANQAVPKSFKFKVMPDTTKPEGRITNIPFVLKPNSPKFALEQIFTVSGTASDPTSVNGAAVVSSGVKKVEVQFGKDKLWRETLLSGGTWSISSLATDFTKVDYDTIHLRISDNVGNISSMSDSNQMYVIVNIKEDRLKPAITIDQTLEGKQIYKGESVLINTNLEDDVAGLKTAVMEYKKTSDISWIPLSNASYNQSTMKTTFSANLTTSNLSAGNYQIRVTAVDQLGKTYTSPNIALKIVEDIAPPEILILYPLLENDVVSKSWGHIGGTVSDDLRLKKVTVSIGSKTIFEEIYTPTTGYYPNNNPLNLNINMVYSAAATLRSSVSGVLYTLKVVAVDTRDKTTVFTKLIRLVN